MTRILDIYPVSQRDPRWKDKPLRKLPETIGLYGCYVVASAMTQNKAPDDAANQMRDAGYFALSSSRVLTFEQLPDSPYKTSDVTKTYYGPVPGDELLGLNAHLRANNPAILEVRLPLANGSKTQHFVLAVGAWGFTPQTLGIVINDPWTGVQSSLCPMYGPTVAKAIYRIIYLVRK